jgi:glycosyltransferase involved in cell wall biosynthesis
MAKPVVSVLMPAFNVEKYIATAIESVLNQTFTNFEFIVLDDGSCDGTVKIIESYDDVRMKTVFLPENKGLVSARNSLVEMAQGQYIAFLDSDDIADAPQLQYENVLLSSLRLREPCR